MLLTLFRLSPNLQTTHGSTLIHDLSIMCSLNNQTANDNQVDISDDQSVSTETVSPDYRSEDQRQTAIMVIRNWRCQNQLLINFTEMALNPYVNGARTMEIYEDENGYEYWVEPRENRLIQAAPAAGKPQTSYQTRQEDRLTITELRKIANEIKTEWESDY